jgi:multimeric flavodoxin WrbA
MKVMAHPFPEGQSEVGVDIDLLYIKALNIHPCRGEFDCWLNPVIEMILGDASGVGPQSNHADSLKEV